MEDKYYKMKEVKLQDLSLNKVNLHNGYILGEQVEPNDSNDDSNIELQEDKDDKFKQIYMRIVKIDSSVLPEGLKIKVRVGDIVTLTPNPNGYMVSVYDKAIYARFKQGNILDSWSL